MHKLYIGISTDSPSDGKVSLFFAIKFTKMQDCEKRLAFCASMYYNYQGKCIKNTAYCMVRRMSDGVFEVQRSGA